MTGTVLSLHRFPVKSLLGEQPTSVHVDARGLAGDRLWSVRDGDGRLGSGKSSRRFRRMDGLLALTARYDGDVPVIGFPDGRRFRGDDPAVHQALSAHVGRPVTLAREADVSHFDEGPVHLVTTASLETLSRAHGRPVDPRRTRANAVVEWPGDGFPELSWVGQRVCLGPDLVLRVRGVMPRCVMVNLAQGEVPADGSVLRSITDVSAGALGVVADVEQPGHVSVGAQFSLPDGRPAPPAP